MGLARSGYYDNTVIWRAQYGFAVQGGDAGGTGSGGATIWSNNPYPLEADSSPVSYTHLDVYKRQGRYAANWFRSSSAESKVNRRFRGCPLQHRALLEAC